MTEKMKAAVAVDEGEIEIQEREIPQPQENEVRIEVKASSVCHSDKYAVEGARPDTEFPRIPGHEVVGVIDEVGEDIENWSEGDKIGVGWHGGHCFKCEACKRGDFIKCENAEITGLTRDGGHAEYMTAREEALAEMPEELDFEEAAPLLCAGVTTFNGLRHTDVNPGDTVAVLGIGGLGHLGVQYAAESGYETVAISHSDKKEYAKELGADHFINSGKEDVAEKLQEIGGADALLSTAPVKAAIEESIHGLGTHGEATIVGVPGENIEVSVGELVGKNSAVTGHSSGTARDSQDTMEFSALRDIKPEIEEYNLEEYAEAYEDMMNGEVRFRAVLKP